MSSDRTAIEGKRGLRELYREERKLSPSATTGNPIQKADQNTGSPTAPTTIEEVK